MNWNKKCCLALLCHNTDLIENVLSALSDSTLISPFPVFFFGFFLDVQYINILSCLELRTFQTIPEKNNLFLARLVVHFCCHIHSCLACDVQPCSLALCCILAAHLNISPSCFFERAEQWQDLAPLHSWSQSGIVTESHAALYIS